MYKQNILLALLLCSIISFSQEIVNSIPVTLKKNRAVFQIVNDSTKETSLFLSDKIKVKAIRLNANMKVIDSLSTERSNPSTYNEMIGYYKKISNPSLFWSSSNHKEIQIQLFDFENHKTSIQTYSLPLKDEIFLQNFSQNKKFYILTILKNSNKLKLYVFDNVGKLEEKTIDLDGFKFFKSDFQKTTLYGVLEETFYSSEQSFSLQKINPESPTSLVECSRKRKCYSNGNTIILTFDTNIDYTQLLTINLDSYSATENFIKKPYLSFSARFDLNSNSFLIDNKLYQIKSSSNEIDLTIKDLNDNLIMSYVVSDTNPIIDFKNTEIIQENGDSSKKRILETSSQFIRKINNRRIGVSSYRLYDNYLTTIGSVSEQEQTNSTMIVGGMFGVAGVLVAAAISNPTMDNFNAYANRKVVYINSLFDKDANHIKGEIDPLAFDKIRIFFNNYSNVSSQTLYKMDNVYYFGYYDDKTQEYTFRKFKD